MEQPVVRQRQDLRRVDRRTAPAARPPGCGPGPAASHRAGTAPAARSARARSRSRAARSRRAPPARHRLARDPARAGAASSTTPTQNPARSNWSSGMTPGCSAVSPPSSAHAGAPASLGHAFHDRRHALGHDLADRQVVQEEQRLGAGAHDVVGAHRDQVDADRVQPTGHPRDLELRADAVGGGGEQPPLPDAEQSREPADLVGHLGPPRARGQVGDQRDGLRGGLGVDAGPAVRVAHRAVHGGRKLQLLFQHELPGSLRDRRPDTPRRSTRGRSRPSASPPPGPAPSSDR